MTPVDPYRHDIDDTANNHVDTTLCGIDADQYPDTEIGCDCKDPRCTLPVTCPVCIMIKDGTVS